MRAPLIAVSTALSVVIFLTGCAANPYSRFYRDYTAEWPPGYRDRLIPAPGEPRVIFSSNLGSDVQRLVEEGFDVIGFAGFQGPPVSQQELISQAKKVKAEVV